MRRSDRRRRSIMASPNAPFSRELLIKTLSNALSSELDAAVTAYRTYYGLEKTAQRYGHQMGICRWQPSAQSAEQRTVVQCFGADNPQRQVMLVHGYLTHTGLLAALIRWLCEHDYQVFCYDLQGHGLSSGERYAITDFFHYSNQLREVLTWLGPRLHAGFSLLGHSTGGGIITTAFARRQPDSVLKPDTQAILLAPLFYPARHRLISVQYGLFGRWLGSVKRLYRPNSHNAEFLQFARRDPLQHNELPVVWVGAMLRWCRWLNAHPPLEYDATIIQGDQDSTVDWQRNIRAFERLFRRTQVRMIHGAMHELINEAPAWQKEVFNAVLQTLESSHASRHSAVTDEASA